MKERLERLRERMDRAACDAFFSFHPPANQYLTGFKGSTSALVVTQSEAIFLCDFRYMEQARQQVFCEHGGYAIEEEKDDLQAAAAKRIDALGAKTAAFDPATLSVAALERVNAHFGGSCKPAPRIVSELRRVKSPAEIDCIRAAAEVGDRVLAAGLAALEPGMTEREFAGWLEFEFRKCGASGAAFNTIVLFGERTSLVHGEPDERRLRAGDVVLVDLGCHLDGYCGDLTRTCAFGAAPGAWFEDIYSLTLAAQDAALEAVRPGISCRELDAVARSIIEQGGHGQHFGHGLGHGVGIEVHEEPRVRKDSDVTLEPGMVITIEPGIYLPGRGGVRIEDLVAVTETGCKCLSNAPKGWMVL